MGLPRLTGSPSSGDLTKAELDGIESDLDKLGTPEDNYFRRMIREIRRRRKIGAPARVPRRKKVAP